MAVRERDGEGSNYKKGTTTDPFVTMRKQREQRIQMLLSLWEAQMVRLEQRAVTFFFEENATKIIELFPAKRKAEQRIQGLTQFLQRMDEANYE